MGSVRGVGNWRSRVWKSRCGSAAYLRDAGTKIVYWHLFHVRVIAYYGERVKRENYSVVVGLASGEEGSETAELLVFAGYLAGKEIAFGTLGVDELTELLEFPAILRSIRAVGIQAVLDVGHKS